MRKPDFCGNRAADQRICFRYMECAIPLLPKPLAIFCGCPAWFVSDLVGNPEDRAFSRHPAFEIRNVSRDETQFLQIFGITSSFYGSIDLIG